MERFKTITPLRFDEREQGDPGRGRLRAARVIRTSASEDRIRSARLRAAGLPAGCSCVPAVLIGLWIRRFARGVRMPNGSPHAG
jgi:hypothetical protein